MRRCRDGARIEDPGVFGQECIVHTGARDAAGRGGGGHAVWPEVLGSAGFSVELLKV